MTAPVPTAESAPTARTPALPARALDVLAALRWGGYPSTEQRLTDRLLRDVGRDELLETLHELLEHGLVTLYWGLTPAGLALTRDPFGKSQAHERDDEQGAE